MAKHDDVTEKSYNPTHVRCINAVSILKSGSKQCLVLCTCMIEPNLASCAITVDHWFMHMVETVFLFRVPAMYHIYV